jgi:hypothetical protein
VNVGNVNRNATSLIGQQPAAAQPTVSQAVHELDHQVATSKPPVVAQDSYVNGQAPAQPSGPPLLRPRKQTREELALKSKHRQQAREQGVLPDQIANPAQSHRHKPADSPASAQPDLASQAGHKPMVINPAPTSAAAPQAFEDVVGGR